ncbi:MAG: PHP domain-containing protein [Candidatus Nanopelagicales bacterium]
MRIDMHTHSTASDGTLSPTAVLDRAALLELDVIALTDHDTFAGLDEAQIAASRVGVSLVEGVELSCMWSGNGDPVRLHLLGYLMDRDDPALAEGLRRVRDDRVPRLQRMTERLAADGIEITWDQVAAVAGSSSVGRPHLADALIATGAVADREEAFDRYLHQGTPYYVPHAAFEVLDAIRLVIGTGGVTVFAHPLARSRGRTVPDEAIEQMTDAGLAGLEVDHRDHSAEDRAHLRGLAARLDLLTTGSSDYHGTGKKDNELGENLTAPDQWERLQATATPPGARRPRV